MRFFFFTMTIFVLLFLPGCGGASDTQEDQAASSNGGQQVAATKAVPKQNGIIGRWLDNVSNPLFSSTLTILVEDGHYYLETKYDDGSSRRTALVEGESDLGRRFDIDPETNAFQMKDYWVIDENGDLLLQNELNPGIGPKASRID
jgi:hypothetical protein